MDRCKGFENLEASVCVGFEKAMMALYDVLGDAMLGRECNCLSAGKEVVSRKSQKIVEQSPWADMQNLSSAYGR